MFTVLLFLLPTTLVFAILFFSLRLVQWAVQIVVRGVVVCINWSTFSGYRFLGSVGSDASLLSARVVTVRGGDVGRGRCDGVWVMWNGRRWSVEEMMGVVDRCDVKCVLGDVMGVRSGDDDSVDPAHPLATTAGLWTTL